MTINVTCEICGKKFTSIRKSRKTCSAACRQRLHRGTGPAPIDRTVFGDLDIDFGDTPSKEEIESILNEVDPSRAVDRLKLHLQVVKENRIRIRQKMNPLLEQCNDLEELLERKLNDARIEMSRVATLSDSEKRKMDHYQHIRSARESARALNNSRPKGILNNSRSGNEQKINDTVTDNVTNTVTGKSRISVEMLSRLKNKRPINDV